MAVSLAVRDAIHEICPGPEINVKWPNDVYVANRKIAGILIQNTVQGPVLSSVIAGIGINVHETDFPKELPNPTSLSIELGRIGMSTPGVMEMLSRVCDALEKRLLEMLDAPEKLRDAYHAHLYMKDELSEFRLPGDPAPHKGYILGADDHGRLTVRWDDGTTGNYAFREIEMII